MTLSHINQNLSWSCCFYYNFLFSSSVICLSCIIFRKLGLVFFTMFVGNTNGLEEPASIPLMKLEPLERRIWQSSKALSALREVVLDKKWLNNLEFYVRFRSVISVFVCGVIHVNLKTVNYFFALLKRFPPSPSWSKSPLPMNFTHSTNKASTLFLHYIVSISSVCLRIQVADCSWYENGTINYHFTFHNNFCFYHSYRHTSVLESYNSMLTKYVPKCMAFK